MVRRNSQFNKLNSIEEKKNSDIYSLKLKTRITW